MHPFDAKLIFAVLGPLFLLLGAAHCVGARAFVPQARTWLLLGAIFTAVAWWLWH